MLANLKTALTDIYHAFDFLKYGHRHLAEFQSWFNRRFNLRSILPRLLRVACPARDAPSVVSLRHPLAPV